MQQFPADFYSYILSDSTLLNSYPILKTYYTGYASGIPSVKVRIKALTANSYSTVTSPGIHTSASAPTHSNSTKIPASGSSARAPAKPTSTLPQQSSVPPTQSSEGQPFSALPSQPTIPTTSSIQRASGVQESQPASQSTAQPAGQPNVPANSHVISTNTQSGDQPATSSQYLPSSLSMSPDSVTTEAPSLVSSTTSNQPTSSHQQGENPSGILGGPYAQTVTMAGQAHTADCAS